MRHSNGRRGYSLAEVLVYMGVLSVVMTVAWLSYYSLVDCSRGLAGNAEDIVRALKAGERWRGDLRAATAPPKLVGGVLHVPAGAGEVLYRLSKDAVERKADAGWAPALAKVKASKMMADQGKHVASWRWEVELRGRREARIRPRFTFMAVPATGEAR